MLIKLIKTREVISGAHCEVWEINPLLEDRLMAEVFVLYEHLPSELFYPLSITLHGIRIRGRDIGWQWDKPEAEQEVYEYLREIQISGEEIYLEVCVPEPDLPGYPYVDRHPVAFDDDITIIQTATLIEEGESCLRSPHHDHYVGSRRGPQIKWYEEAITSDMIVLMGDLNEDERPEEPTDELFDEAEYV